MLKKRFTFFGNGSVNLMLKAIISLVWLAVSVAVLLLVVNVYVGTAKMMYQLNSGFSSNLDSLNSITSRLIDSAEHGDFENTGISDSAGGQNMFSGIIRT
jgi:hypothetical protein